MAAEPYTQEPYTQQVISYAYIQGRWYSFPSPFAAKLAVQRYNGNMESVRTERPTGVNIDTSLGWNLEGGKLPETILPAPGVTGDALWNPPLNPIIRKTPIDTPAPSPERPTNPYAPDPAPAPDPVPVPNPMPIAHDSSNDYVDDPTADPSLASPVDSWDDLDQDLLNLAKRYADAGMMGRAKAAFEQAGGSWDTDTHKRMVQERDQTDSYGGLFDFEWARRGITDAADLEQIKAWAKGNLYGKIKQFMEAKKPGSFDKEVHVKLKAFTHRGKHDFVNPSTVTKDTPGAYLDTRTGKWRMPAPDGTTPGAEHVYDPASMKGTREEIEGKFKTGARRQDAKIWRQQHMDAAKEKWGHGTDDFNQAEYIKQRNAIANRHRVMIDAGPKTLADGTVIGGPAKTATPHVYDPSKMKGTRKEIGGKFKTGQARQDANTWRQQHMAAAEKKHGIKRNAAGKVVKPANEQAWNAYLAQRNKIAGRHRGMIGAGPKTLKSGKVIGW